MGWTEYSATHFKKGKVDRLEECRNILNRDNIVCDGLVGSTYYCAYRNGKDVIGLVVLTSVRDKYLFAYKDMDETMLPYYYDCPLKVLKALTSTDNENAIKWREECMKQRLEKGNRVNLSKLPIGSFVEVTIPYETTYFSKGEKVILEKIKYRKTSTWITKTHTIRFTNRFMSRCVNENAVKVL